MKWKAECNFVRACGLHGHEIPLFRTRFILRRQYAQAPYFSLAPDRKLPTPNKRHLASFDDYNKAAAMGGAKAIGSSHLNLELVVRFDIYGQNTPAGHGQ